MSRKLRVEFPGAIYHVMSRGDRREDIFRDDVALAARLRRETALRVGWIAHRLHLGTRKSAAVKLHRWGNTKQEVKPDRVKTMV